MVADVQRWLDDPAISFGWLLKGIESQPSTPKQFDSRESSNAANRPTLTVEYTSGSPSVLQLSNSTYNVTEGIAGAAVTVRRLDGSSGQVTVDYATSDASATAGSNYANTTGTLTFPDGDTGDKTFTIPILDDPFVEGDETVKITLTNPAGNATLGSPTTALLIIQGNDTEVDVNEDGFVDTIDLEGLLAGFGLPSVADRTDVNGDGIVNVLDLVLVALNQGRLAPQPLATLRIEPAFPNLTFGQPTNLVQPDDGHDHIMITSQPGVVHVFPNDENTGQSRVFLDLRDRVVLSSEEGLLGLAFDPDYRSNGFFYIYY